MSDSESRPSPPFHAYIHQPEIAALTVLYFANASTAEKWWSIVLNHASEWSPGLQKSDFNRSGHQWFTMKSNDSPANWAKKMHDHPAMGELYGCWTWKRNPGPESMSFANTNIPMAEPGSVESNNKNGAQSQAILDMLSKLNDNISNMNSNRARFAAPSRIVTSFANGSTTPTTETAFSIHSPTNHTSDNAENENWADSDESFRIHERAFRMAKQMKREGDTRPFGMLFGQVSMELRRK